MTSHTSDKPRFLPLALDLRGKPCLVIGGGRVGTRKALTLLRAGAMVTIISPTVTEELTEHIEAGRLRWVRDSFRVAPAPDAQRGSAASAPDGEPGSVASAPRGGRGRVEEHLAGAFLVVAATNDEAANAAVVRRVAASAPDAEPSSVASAPGGGRESRQAPALVCDASSAERSELIFGALLEIDDVTIAVFTDGCDPARAKRTRDQIANLLAKDEEPVSNRFEPGSEDQP